MADINQINAALDANADWFTEGSVAKCGAWISAATQLLHRPEESQRSGQGTGARVRTNLQTLREELKFARNWYARNKNRGGRASETGADFTEFDQRRYRHLIGHLAISSSLFTRWRAHCERPFRDQHQFHPNAIGDLLGRLSERWTFFCFQLLFVSLSAP
jgi:hypothetical protein